MGRRSSDRFESEALEWNLYFVNCGGGAIERVRGVLCGSYQ